MTPNFALSLSVDGIRLLHRVTGGWHVVGEVALDTPDLGAALKVLRKTALELDPAGLRTKLLIPNDQIKYTAIDSTQTDLDDVHAALDGLTPYSINDLVIDFDRSGGRTHIAAVARETLDEAEAFATEHNFAPVGFAAVSPPFTFSGEVFFGPTKAASTILGDETAIERDSAAVVVIGSAALPTPAPVPMPAPDVEEPVAPAKEDAPAKEEPETTDADDSAPDIVFSSRNRTMPPKDDLVLETPEVEDPEPIADPEVEPLFTRRKEPPVLPPELARAEPPVMTLADPDEPLFTARSETVTPVPAPPVGAAVTPDPVPDASTFNSIRATAGDDNIAPPAPTPDPVVAAPPPPVVAEPAPERKAKKTAAKAETETMTVFGARKDGKVGGKPKYLGLILTAVLLLFMLLAALWANTLTEDGIAGWFKSQTELIDTADVPTPVIQTAPADDADVAVAPTQDAVPAPPVLRQPSDRVLSADEADRIYAATGVYQRAPRFPNIPRETSIEGFQEAKAITDLSPMTALAMPDLDAMFPDTPLTVPANPPPPDIEFARDLGGFILATPEGTLTPDGVIVIAGQPERIPPLRPGTEVVVPEPTETVAVPEGEEGLILIAGRPPIVPPLRPDSIGPEDEAAVLPEVETEVIEVPAVAPVVITDALDALPDDSPRISTNLPAIGRDDAPTVFAAVPSLVTQEQPNAFVAPVNPAAFTPPVTLDLIAGRPAVTPPLRPIEQAVLPTDIPETDETVETADVAEGLDLIIGRPALEPPLRPEAFAALAPAAPTPEETAPVEGVDLILGRPALVPPLRPAAFAELAQAFPDPAATETPVAEATEDQPEGLIVVAGRPDLVPPLRPATVAARATVETPEPDTSVIVNPTDVLANNGTALVSFRPSLRPEALAPPAETQIAAVIADPALAGFRPSVRPTGLAPIAEPEVVAAPATPDINSVIAAIAEAAPPSPIVNATAQAIVVSPRPGPRPRNFGQVVSRAQAATQQRQTAAAPAATAPTTQVSSAAVAPTGPVPGGVARAATVDNAIRLRDINLIGVYGRPNDRRALVRMSNGRYVKVEVGSRLDGGRVTAIGDDALNYVKSGRTLALQLPSG